MDDWQDISTAPKGEPEDPEQFFQAPKTLINVWAGSFKPYCFFDWESGYWMMVIRYVTRSGARKTVYNRIKDVTHWQPVPKGPGKA